MTETQLRRRSLRTQGSDPSLGADEEGANDVHWLSLVATYPPAVVIVGAA